MSGEENKEKVCWNFLRVICVVGILLISGVIILQKEMINEEVWSNFLILIISILTAYIVVILSAFIVWCLNRGIERKENKDKYFDYVGAIVWQVISIGGIILIIVLFNLLYKNISNDLKVNFLIFIIVLLMIYIISLALAAWYISKRYILNEFIEKMNDKFIEKMKDFMGANKFKVSFDMDGYSFSLEVKNDGVPEAQGTSGTSDTKQSQPKLDLEKREEEE